MWDEPAHLVLELPLEYWPRTGPEFLPWLFRKSHDSTEQSHLETMGVRRWTSLWPGLFRKPELLGHWPLLFFSGPPLVAGILRLMHHGAVTAGV